MNTEAREGLANDAVSIAEMAGALGGVEEAPPIEEGPLYLTTEMARVGGAQELHPKDRARLVMAYWVLGAVLFLMVLSAVAYVGVSCSPSEAAKEVFEFVKGFGPPLVTLVLGFYFRDAFSGSES